VHALRNSRPPTLRADYNDHYFAETCHLFRRKFGPSKRFSEADKREVSDMIAVKLQLSQDDWRRETEKVRTELERLTTEIQERDERLVPVVNPQLLYTFFI